MTSIRIPEWLLVAGGMLIVAAVAFYPVEILLALSALCGVAALGAGEALLSAAVIDRSKLFSALRVEADCERVVSILKRQHDEAATTATLYEIRRLRREAAQRRAGIDGLLTRLNDDVEHLRPSDSGTPS